jgi:hypothetical protein
MQKARGVIQTKRIYEFAAGRAARRKKLLQITQRDPSDGCHLVRAEIRIGKALFDTPRIRAISRPAWRETGNGSGGANSAPGRAKEKWSLSRFFGRSGNVPKPQTAAA